MKHAIAIVSTVFLVGCAASNDMASILGGNARQFFAKPAPVSLRARPSFRAGQTAVTSIGHATTVIQIDDRFVLTDPVFTDTVGTVSRRLVAPGIPVEELPPTIDAILISHQHFDHLSFGSLDMVRSHARNLLVPVGTSAMLPEQGFAVWELPWQATYHDRDLSITSVQVKHVSGRYGLDSSWRTRGFAGYLIRYHGKVIFYAGDTALAPELAATIKSLAGAPIDLALLPIAPIHPRGLMARTHVDPIEALAWFSALGAREMVAIHYDTFINSADRFGEAAALTRAEAQRRGIGDHVHVLAPGEQFVLEDAR